MAVIAGDLHCDAVRVSGRDGERLSVAARHAADAGLEVWFSPFPVDLPPGELLPFLTDCAQRAEAVRQAGAEVVLVTGCEMSAFCSGFLPGDTYLDRLKTMVTADLPWWMSLGPVQERLNAFLAEATAAVRSSFGGRVTYASGPWEAVDWAPFDLVSVDAYRAAHNAGTFTCGTSSRTASRSPLPNTARAPTAARVTSAAWRRPHAGPGKLGAETASASRLVSGCMMSSSLRIRLLFLRRAGYRGIDSRQREVRHVTRRAHGGRAARPRSAIRERPR
jgi:hypothetical protein